RVSLVEDDDPGDRTPFALELHDILDLAPAAVREPRNSVHPVADRGAPADLDHPSVRHSERHPEPAAAGDPPHQLHKPPAVLLARSHERGQAPLAPAGPPRTAWIARHAPTRYVHVFIGAPGGSVIGR